MAALNDLIAQISDDDLRRKIQNEVEKLAKQKKFGLVFENHLPEIAILYDAPIVNGCKVMLRDSDDEKKIYRVLKVEGEEVICSSKYENDKVRIHFNDLVRIAEFGEAIYPCLKQIDSVCNAPDSDLWHTLIEADNYHALQLLEYLYAGKVDCIYIDPPYNTGAKDWKYNNDYVDSSDVYRHSKWLSMMEKRLKLAKNLLNPENSVLIVTIDEKEYLHLGCLLEELFSDAKIQMVSSVINAGGSVRAGEFSRTDEYIFFVKIGASQVCPLPLGTEWRGGKQTNSGPVLWRSMLRGGEASAREDRPNMFFPILVDKKSEEVVGVGDVLPLGVPKEQYIVDEDKIAVWPIRKDGSDGRWRIGIETAKEDVSLGYIKANKSRGRITISYLAAGIVDSINKGEIIVTGKGKNAVFESVEEHKIIPGTAWQIASHDASKNGTAIVKSILGARAFSFPKSLYAVHDALRFFLSEKNDALILDFFAGSGTTLHAVNLLNAEDGGHRRCILVTNNEVSEAESKDLKKRGFKPGDPEWEKCGIANSVTWPRTVCSIEGHDIDGKALEGNYTGTELPLSDGFKSNAVFFKLAFLDKTAIALGMQFRELLSVIWMKAGAYGRCPEITSDNLPNMLVLPQNKMAVLINENDFLEFKNAVNNNPEIRTVFLVTDYEVNYRSMVRSLNVIETYQLYRDYLDNFRINHGRN